MSAKPGHGTLDGAWWPRSNDLQRELPSLIADLPDELGRVMRVVYAKSSWLPTPRWVKLDATRSLRTGSFAGVDTHRILLQTARHGVLQIMLVPPGVEPAIANRLMQDASSLTNLSTADSLLADAVGNLP